MRARAQLIRAAAAAGLCAACVPRTPASIASDAPDPAPPEVVAGLGEGSGGTRTDLGDRVAPEISSVELVDPLHLRVRFSERLGPEQRVEPAQFRVSFAYEMIYGESEAYAYYVDPLVAMPPVGPPPPLQPAEAPRPYAETDYDPRLEVVSLQSYADGWSLGLELGASLPLELCLEIQDIEDDIAQQRAPMGQGPPGRGRVGLFLHYASAGGGAVTDVAGNGLGDLGGHWALNRGARAMHLEGRPPVSSLDRLPPIPCPDPLPELDADGPGSPRRPPGARRGAAERERPRR